MTPQPQAIVGAPLLHTASHKIFMEVEAHQTKEVSAGVDTLSVESLNIRARSKRAAA